MIVANVLGSERKAEIKALCDRRAYNAARQAAFRARRGDEFRQQRNEKNRANIDHVRAMSRAWFADNTVLRKQYKRNQQQIMNSVMLEIKYRAKERHWPVPDFDGTWLLEKANQQGNRCEICSVEMTVAAPGRPGTNRSVDRIDNDQPYLKFNIAIVCLHCNRVKNSGTAAEHERIAAWMRTKGVS